MNTLIKQLPDRFFIDLAIGASPFEDICKLYKIKPETIEPHWDDPFFQHRLALAEQAVADDGSAFRARCRTVVHDSIPRIQQIINDPDVPAQTQLTAFQTLVKYSGMEPTPAQKQIGTGPSLSLTIIGPGGESQRIEAHMGPAQLVEDGIDPEDFESIPLASPEESRMFSISL